MIFLLLYLIYYEKVYNLLNLVNWNIVDNVKVMIVYVLVLNFYNSFIFEYWDVLRF